jgi:repressor LexA
MRKIDEAYQYIKDYINEKGFPPTIREIAESLNIKSTSTVAYYLRKLEMQNKIVKGNYKNRSIQITENVAEKLATENVITMPCVSKLTMRKSLFYEPNVSEKYIFSGSLFKGLDMFLMPVKDDSMKASGILKGDMVVVSRQNVARNGELVVALLDSDYLIAKLYREFNLFKLHQDNTGGKDAIYAEKVVILGKVVGVIRNEMD